MWHTADKVASCWDGNAFQNEQVKHDGISTEHKTQTGGHSRHLQEQVGGVVDRPVGVAAVQAAWAHGEACAGWAGWPSRQQGCLPSLG